MAVFSSSVLITIVTVVHAAYIYVAQLRVMPVLAYIEVLAPIRIERPAIHPSIPQISIAVLVCNFSVLGTWAFRSLWKNEEFTTEVNPITTFSIGITTTHQAELDANATSEIPSTALTNFSTHEGIKSTESIEKRLTSRSLLSQVSSGPPSVHTLEDNIPLH